MIARLALAALVIAASAPALAASKPPVISRAERAIPTQVPVAQRAAWRTIYADLRAGRLETAASGLAAATPGPLAAHVEAELLLARGAAGSRVTDPKAWLAANLDLPQAPRLAARLGAPLDGLPAIRTLRWINYTPAAARAPRGDGVLDGAMRPLIAADQPAAAEEVWLKLAPSADPAARAQWAQRAAWLYYIDGDDLGAARLGRRAAEGTGEHAALGSWVVGLAAWRQDDCATAVTAFDGVATRGASSDLAAAAAYWASRAHLACGRPDLVSKRLAIAAAHRHSFYGMLARRALGLESPLNWAEPDFIKADWNHLDKLPGARRAAALVEIGQLGLADRELRHLATIADPAHYEAIMRLAARLSLPATQLWLSQRSPSGAHAPLAARYPAPAWVPARGWRVEQSLVYAHALQESRFATDVVSHAGARGVMQMMPATAAQIGREMGEPSDAARLNDPSFNIECGQTYMEELRDSVWTGGLLPKVIAAYNAGPGSVQKWNASVRDKGDPLLFIESIPFKETRHYVEVVLKNYWMYQLRDGVKPASMDALAAGMWPRFPGLPGATAVKMTSPATVGLAAYR